MLGGGGGVGKGTVYVDKVIHCLQGPTQPRREGVLPYIIYIDLCRSEGYGF